MSADRVTGESWEKPISLEGPAPPPFPLGVLPRRLEAWVEAIATAYQVPADLPAMLALGCISAAVAGRASVRVAPDWTEELCAYVACVLPSGERKSPVVREAAAPLEQWERNALERERERVISATEHFRVAEKRLAHARELAAKAADDADRRTAEEQVDALAVQVDRLERRVFPRLLADDATPEALVSLMAEQGGRIAMISAEGGLFDILTGRYSDAPNLDAVLKAYDCEPIRVDRKGRASEFVDEPALSLVFAVQPSVLTSLAASPQLRGRGFLARFAYAVPQSALGHRDLDPPSVPGHVRAAYQARVSELLDGAAKSAQSAQSASNCTPRHLADCAAVRPELTLSNDAEAILRDYRRRLEPRLDPETGDLFPAADWVSKHPGRCVRIAGLLHFFEHGWSLAAASQIDGSTMRAAVAIGDYLVSHALVALGLAGPHSRDTAAVGTLLRWIRREKLTAFKASDALDALPRSQFPQMGSVNAALRRLEEFRYIRVRPSDGPQGPGRPASPTYDVSPFVFEQASWDSSVDPATP